MTWTDNLSPDSSDAGQAVADGYAAARRVVVDPRVSSLVRSVLVDVRGVRGVLVATNDGHAVTSEGIDDKDSAAAIVASAGGIGQRLSELCGDGALNEIVVRSPTGYAVVYAVGAHAAMTVITDTTTNLALLHLRARDLITDLEVVLDAMLSR